jgi:transcriptional antiterminator RfaH
MSDEKVSEGMAWYVIHTKPKEEARAERNLQAWHMETFVPKIRERRYCQYSSNYKAVVKSLFPRYIFVRFEASKFLHKVCYTRGVQSVISFGNGPVPVHDEVLSMIRKRIGADGFVKTIDEMEPGDEVLIKDGPFKGFSGVFDHNIKGSDRSMILLLTVNYQAHVAVETALIKKCKSLSQ